MMNLQSVKIGFAQKGKVLLMDTEHFQDASSQRRLMYTGKEKLSSFFTLQVAAKTSPLLPSGCSW